LGLWSTPTTNPDDYSEFGSAEFEKSAYDAAADSITLLKNDGDLLPLAPGTKILVAGPNADSMRTLNGGWSYSWQGDAVNRYATAYNTVLKALQNVAGVDNVVYAPGVRWIDAGKYWEEEEVDIEAAVAAAANVDVIVLVIGENSYTEKPGDLQDLSLSPLQLKLGARLIETGKPVVLALNEGRPRIIESLVAGAKGVFQLYLPGNFGGDAFADILFGTVNPSGKLSYNYPRYRHSLVSYWHKYSEEQTAQPGAYNYESDYSPLWEFGTGLSYTKFEYSNLKLSSPEIGAADILKVTLTVANVGNRAGKEAVLLYTSDLYATTAPDAKRLRRFTKVSLDAGTSTNVAFEIDAEALSFINTENKRVTEPGEFRVSVGSLYATVRFK
jgi:beta-glucosidase